MKTVYGHSPQGRPHAMKAMLSIEGYLNGAVGIKRRDIGTENSFWRLIRDVYGIERPDVGFWDAIIWLQEQLQNMSRAERKRRQKEARQRLGTKPNKGKARVKHAPSASKIKAREAYRKKHLVLVTSDGKELFDNVKECASKEKRDAFYLSWDWRTLRMKILKRNARRCMCCGSTPDDLTVSGEPVRLVVDHIRPISRYWHLRLVPSNLQILCDECNMGKGAWDETDHRSDMERQIADQLRYEIGGAS